MADTLEELKRKGVLSHRILSMTGNMGAGTGHVFVRTPEGNEFLARSRHAGDTSPAFVNEDAYHLMTMDGKPAEDMGDWVYPPERHIAMAIFKARAETNVVIHAHPMYQVLCSIANVPLRPIVGPAYGGEAVTAAVKGIRVFPRTNLISSVGLGRAVQATMGNNDALILKSHGNVITGTTIETATLRAISVESLANICWAVATSRREASDILNEDFEEQVSPQQAASIAASAGNSPLWPWDYYVRLLDEGGMMPALAMSRQRFGQ